MHTKGSTFLHHKIQFLHTGYDPENEFQWTRSCRISKIIFLNSEPVAILSILCQVLERFSFSARNETGTASTGKEAHPCDGMFLCSLLSLK